DPNYDVAHGVDRPLAWRGWAGDLANQRLDSGAPRGLAERGVPGAILGEQRRHVGEPVQVDAEAVFGKDITDRVLLLEQARHRHTSHCQPADPIPARPPLKWRRLRGFPRSL